MKKIAEIISDEDLEGISIVNMSFGFPLADANQAEIMQFYIQLAPDSYWEWCCGKIRSLALNFDFG